MQRILTRALACAALLLTLNTFAGPADGTWTWTQPGRNGGPDRVSTLKLTSEGDKLNGTITGGGRGGGGNAPADIKITDGTIKGDDVSFKVTRPGRNGGEGFTTKYTGKVSGDTLKLKTTFTNQNGEEQTREIEAKKKTEEKK